MKPSHLFDRITRSCFRLKRATGQSRTQRQVPMHQTLSYCRPPLLGWTTGSKGCRLGSCSALLDICCGKFANFMICRQPLYLVCFSTPNRPTSRGMLTLRSADPFDAPIIDPKYTSGLCCNSRCSLHDPDLIGTFQLVMTSTSSSVG